MGKVSVAQSIARTGSGQQQGIAESHFLSSDFWTRRTTWTDFLHAYRVWLNLTLQKLRSHRIDMLESRAIVKTISHRTKGSEFLRKSSTQATVPGLFFHYLLLFKSQCGFRRLDSLAMASLETRQISRTPTYITFFKPIRIQVIKPQILNVRKQRLVMSNLQKGEAEKSKFWPRIYHIANFVQPSMIESHSISGLETS